VHVVGGASAPAGGFAVLDDGEWQKALDQNLFAAVRLDRALVPLMIEQGSGAIIHITSIQGRMPTSDGSSGYGMLAMRGIEVGAAVVIIAFGTLLLAGYMVSERLVVM
jgi:NAD(P)-dependent dehydrogenase (short-subunit alcohol dehydrogenase family)